MVTVECVIPQKHHRTVMGAKGFKVQNITSEFDVQIKFPEREQQHDENNTNNAENQQINGDENGEAVQQTPEHPLPCDIVRITGQPEKVEAAKQALLDLVPVVLEVEVPFDLHRLIIGRSGRDVRTLMSKYDVHITLSSAEEKQDLIKIIGRRSCVEEAKEAVLERCRDLEAQKQERELKSYELKVKFNEKKDANYFFIN